jgi:hypothetical protein
LKEALVYLRKAAHIATLWPLLAAGYTTERAGMANINGKPAYAIEANDCLNPLVTLYFDKATFKLVRFSWKGGLDGKSRVGTIAVTIQAYKTMGGVVIPWKRVVTFNGKKVLADETTKAKLGKVNAAKLAKPAHLPPAPREARGR